MEELCFDPVQSQIYVVVFFNWMLIFLHASIICINFVFLFQTIDVDQIVMEHYHSSCTPKPSISRLPSITPNAGNDKFARQDETCLPPELCSICNHGCKVCVFFE